MTLPQFGQEINPIDAGSVVPAVVNGWELIADVTLPVDASQVEVTGLDGDADEMYLLICDVFNPSGVATPTGTLRFNNDSGDNYGRQVGSYAGGAETEARNFGTSLDIAFDVGFDGNSLLVGYIAPVTGNLRETITQVAGGFTTEDISMNFVSGRWDNTVDNVTSIQVLFSNDIGAGSRLWLYRPSQEASSPASPAAATPSLPTYGLPVANVIPASGAAAVVAAIGDGWELIEDITVPADTTQVDITDLDGNADEQYQMVVIIDNPDAVLNCDMKLRFNGDSGANYNRQSSTWDGGGAPGANRVTGQTEMDLEWDINATVRGIMSFMISASQEDGRWRTLQGHNYSGSEAAPLGHTAFGEWENAVDNITQISLFSANADTIAAGSRIWLFRPSR